MTTLIPEVSIGEVLHTTDDYAVRIDEIIDPETKLPMVIYAIVSTETGVREAELRGYANAIQWANKMQGVRNEVRETEMHVEQLRATFAPDDEFDPREDFDEDLEPKLSKGEALDLLN